MDKNLAALLVAAVLAGRAAGAGAAEPPKASAEGVFGQETCSLCHIRESVFFDRRLLDRGGGAEAFGEAKVCESCHNGSVRDDRAVLWRGAQHPPPRGAAGKPCSRCHSPHGPGGWSVLAGTAIPLWGGGDTLCSGCHAGYRSRGDPLHAKGIGAGGCSECHRAHGGVGRALLREKGDRLCLRCHAAAEPGRDAEGHPALGAGSRRPGEDVSCLGCHPVHGGDARARAEARCAACHLFEDAPAAGRRHPGAAACSSCHTFHARRGEGGKGFGGGQIDALGLCGGCHAAYAAQGRLEARAKGTHPAAGEKGAGGCLSCHVLHRPAPGTALLRSARSYTCLACHAQQDPIREEGGRALSHPEFERLPSGRLRVLARARSVYLGPAGEIACQSCHSVHRAAPGGPLLAPGFEGEKGCFRCHEEKEGAVHARRPGLRDAPGCADCHPVHGLRGAGPDPWSAVCGRCHPVRPGHSASRRKTAATPSDLPLFDSRGRVAAGGFVSCPTCHEQHVEGSDRARLRRPYIPSAFLCTACHREKESVALTPHDLRGIAGSGLCDPCHVPHGAGVGASGPPEAQAGRAAACDACHAEGGLGSPVAGGHPVNMVVLRPLPPLFPLSAEGLDIRAGGRMTCSTCHDPHGSGLPPQGKDAGKFLRSTPAQEAAFPAAFDQACGECHAGRGTNHGGTPCGACHPAHGKDGPFGACVRCHRPAEAGTAAAHLRRGAGCGSCHAVHAAGGRSEGRAHGCAGCHPRSARIVGTPHALLEGGPCGACHPAHAALPGVSRPRRPWEEVFAPDALCTRCHVAGGIGPILPWMDHPKNRRKVPTTYGATVALESPVVMVGRLLEEGRPLFPLFADNGASSLAGRLGCLTCHDPHAGTKLEKEGAMGYLRDPAAVFLAEICVPCHKEGAVEHVRGFHSLPRKAD